MIKALIEMAFAATARYRETADEAFRPKLLPPEPFSKGIPTLQAGVYRPVSPMLKERFERCGRWTVASHGDWLSAADMESLWSEAATAADTLLYGIKQSQIAAAEGWPNEASTLFRPERLSFFAGSDHSYERIYLLWIEYEDEPELWVYDANGESRYRDLSAYLQAYLAADVSAASQSWRA